MELNNADQDKLRLLRYNHVERSTLLGVGTPLHKSGRITHDLTWSRLHNEINNTGMKHGWNA